MLRCDSVTDRPVLPQPYGGYRGCTKGGGVDTQVRSEAGGMEGANGLSPMGKGVMVLEGAEF